jgi:transposase-like protein
VSEIAAYRDLELVLWPHGPTCPHCRFAGAYYLSPENGATRKTRTGSFSARRVWRCRDCGQQFSVLVGTALHGTKVPVGTWLRVLRGGWPVGVREFARRYGVDLSTAQSMRRRLAVQVVATLSLQPTSPSR